VRPIADATSAHGDNRHVARRVSSPDFVGRAEELAALQAALGRAAGGDAAAVFVAGESGVGKTRLLRELDRLAANAGARVMRGTCAAFGAGELPYAPIAGALRGLMRELGAQAFDELVGPRRTELARLLPELGADSLPSGSDGAGMMATGEPLGQARPSSWRASWTPRCSRPRSRVSPAGRASRSTTRRRRARSRRRSTPSA
jgi:hypothetical protein